jgi:hypothetical protein
MSSILGAEVLDVLLQRARVHAPPVLGGVAVEKRVHDIDGFVGELVCLYDALVARHFHDEATLRFVLALLDADFAAVDGAISSERIVKSALEDGE